MDGQCWLVWATQFGEGTCPRQLWLDVTRSTGMSFPGSYGQIHRASWDQDFYYSRRRGITGCCWRRKSRKEPQQLPSFLPWLWTKCRLFPLSLSHTTPSRSPSCRELSLQLPSSLLPAKKQNKGELTRVDGENLYWYLIQNGISSALRVSVLVLQCTGDISDH